VNADKLIGYYQRQKDNSASVDFSYVIAHKFGEMAVNAGVEYRWSTNKSRFSSNVSLYLGNGRR